MALYIYTKDKPYFYKKIVNIFSYTSLIAGALLLFWSFYPIIFFQLYSKLVFKQKFTSPLPEYRDLPAFTSANSVLGVGSIFSTNLSEFTKAGMWFPQVQQEKNDILDIKEYTLSIPRLNITKAKVIVGGEDLNKGLIHYKPVNEVMPGSLGKISIFGHSILPQLAKRGQDLHYKSIFTYLPSMERGDTIYVHVKNDTFEYEIVDMFVVKPTEVSILEQNYEEATMLLITCVPPGSYNERLVVKTRLKSI